METKKRSIDELIVQFHDYLVVNGRSNKTISRFSKHLQQIRSYMLLNRLYHYDKGVELQYLRHVLGEYDYYHLTIKQRNFIDDIESFDGFQRTGTALAGLHHGQPKVFKGLLGETIEKYLTDRAKSLNLSKVSAECDRLNMYKFYRFLTNKGLSTPEKISEDVIFAFINQLDANMRAIRYLAVLAVKRYLQFLYDEHLVARNYAKIVPNAHYPKQALLPSTFSKDEIKNLLQTVDRSNPKGKRDYAILLLAVRLGLRSSDIAALTFENISWDSQSINLVQRKTGRDISLPLLPDIGNALIDYMKNGRPISIERHCFLQLLSPFKSLQPKDIYGMLNRYLRNAGINIKNRKHGPHALRHSVADRLLQEKTPLPVITEVLGHKNVTSTMFYIRIDKSSLGICALAVPTVPAHFYSQKGGFHK